MATLLGSLPQFVRHIRRNPQKSPADLVPHPEKTVKQRKTSQKGASGSGKPKKAYVSPQERLVVEHVCAESIEPSTVSEETFPEIHKAPCLVSSPLDISPKETSLIAHQFPYALSFIS